MKNGKCKRCGYEGGPTVGCLCMSCASSRISELEDALRRLISEAHNDGKNIWIDANDWDKITKDEQIVSEAT